MRSFVVVLILAAVTTGCRGAPERDDTATPAPAGEAWSAAFPAATAGTPANEITEADLEESDGWSKERKLVYLNATTTLGVLVYGFTQWNYGEQSFNFDKEGWFGAETGSGGADKLGHAYAAYLATLGYSALYEKWGFPRREADIYGALSGFAAFAMIEVGDAMSDFGFSLEDLAVDAFGAGFGYLRRRYPRLGEILDFRVEYVPSEATLDGRTDYFTDYSGFKYLFALKLAGFERLSPTPLQYLEIHVGYYTRGYQTDDAKFFDQKSRNLYAGVGLNLSRVFKKLGWGVPSGITKYYQVPYTYAATTSRSRRRIG